MVKWPQIDAAFNFIKDNPAYTGPYRNKCFYEFGVYRCGSLRKTLVNTIAYRTDWDKYYGFDSFEGLPTEKDGVAIFEKYSKGSYTCSLGICEQYCYKDFPYFWDNKRIKFIKGFYEKLTSQTVVENNMKPALLCHIDCDLYRSSYDALKFMFSSRLINNLSLIAFDEFQSVSSIWAGGEAKAWLEVCNKYRVEAKEVWHQIYYDKDTGQEIRQNLFQIRSIGTKIDLGINI